MGELLFLAHPLLAFVLALPLALERERSTNIMGIRTYSLVAAGSCVYAMIGVNSFGGEDAQARALQGLLSGLGFLGGGAILKQEDHVSGTACAATIWVVGALGAAVGFGAYKIALSLSLLAWFVLGSLKRFKRGRGPDDGASDAPIDA